MELETPFKKSLADNFDNNVIKQQLSYLTRFSWHDKLVKSWNPKSPTPKNNLPSPTYVDGYKRNKKYLVMQQPQKEMSSRFWNVVVENKISHILFLNKLRVSRHSVNSYFIQQVQKVNDYCMRRENCPKSRVGQHVKCNKTFCTCCIQHFFYDRTKKTRKKQR
jgi:hypothetical protein